MTPLELALSYSRKNVPVFPCRSEDEQTDQYDAETGEFITLKAKTPLTGNGFKAATKNERIINILFGERHPTAMVGAPTGESMGAWVLDIDVHKDDDGNVVNGYETMAALEDKHGSLPRTAVAKTAGGGEHHYFRYAPGVRNRGHLGAGLDVRGVGGYVVMPGSVLADGKGYHWLDWDGDGLPPLPDAPGWLLDLVLPPQQAVTTSSDYSHAAGQNDIYVERAVEAELSDTASVPMGAGRNNRLNQASFNLGQWVGGGHLSESAARSLLQDVARSWGRDWRQCCKTIDNGLKAGVLVPRHPPASDFDDMGGWGTLDYRDLATRYLEKRASAANQGHDTDREHPAPQEATTEAMIPIGNIDEDDEAPDYTLATVADLESLTYPGGLVEDLIDWITSSAEQPSRPLALAAVLPLVATLAGSRFSTGSKDTRPNLYTVALAESGFGKEHARSQIKRLLMSSQGIFDDFSGPARIMSASALREVLERHSSVNCQIDEFGGFVREITDRKAGSHQRAISTDLRDYYSASTTYFEGAAYRGTPPKRIYNPNLCLHGTSTPEQFWTALSSASAEDGLLPRLILFHVKGDKPASVKANRDVRDVPTLLLEKMAAVAGIDVVKRRSATKLPQVAAWQENKPHIVPWTPDALALFRSVKEAVEEQERRVAVEGKPFVRRIIENAIKLALIVAVGIDPSEPVISEATFDWATAVAWSCAAEMLTEVTERLADNQREANYKKIAALIRKAGNKGLTEGRLLDKCKAIEAWQRDDILKDLVNGGRVIVPVNDNKRGRPSKRYVWFELSA